MAANPKTQKPLVEIGDSGLSRVGGYVRDEFLPALSGARAAKVYRQMADNDPVVGAVLYAIEMLVRQVEWSVQPADDSPAAEEAAAFVESVLDDMDGTWADALSEILTMLTYGFAPIEIVWKKRNGPDRADPAYRSDFTDGRFGIRKLALRAQDTIVQWEFDPAGAILGLHQQTPEAGSVYIPAERFALFRTTARKNNPEGRSILRNAYRPWLFKQRIEEIEGIGLERDLAGLPVLRLPSEMMDADADEATKAAFAAYKRLVTQVRRDQQEGVILPSDRDESGNYFYEFSLLSTGGARQFDTTKVIDRYDRRIATSVLADFIFLGQGSSGSWALSSDKTELFATAIGTYLGTIRDTMNRVVLRRLWAINGMPYDTLPILQHGDIEKPNLGELGAFIGAMSGAGATLFPDRDLENSLRQTAGLPPAPEEGVEGDPSMAGPDDASDPDAAP